MKKISLKYIADTLKISRTTVSLVLNGKGNEGRIKPETQKKILEFAKEHNYKPNQVARSLSRGKSDTLGLIVPRISDTFYARIAQQIERRANDSGYNVMYCSTEESPEKESEQIQAMLDRQVDGLIIASCQKNKKDIRQLKKNNFPFVLIDRHYPDIDTNFVIVDNKGGVYNAVEHLLEQKRQRVAFVTLTPELDAIVQRLNGYKAALSDNNVEVDKTLIKELRVEEYEDKMPVAIDELIKLNVDSIVFSTHYLTISGVRALKTRGIKIPEDIAIVSFDQTTAFDIIEPPMSAVVQPVDRIGEEAVNSLISIMQSENSDIKQVKLSTDFIPRDSSIMG